MNVEITSFRNPFSFFCIMPGDIEPNNNVCIILPESRLKRSKKCEINAVKHGQYVAVMWHNQWARGIVTLETQFLIWLVDYGIYLRPDENTAFVELPPEEKKPPTRVFEASIHGCTPLAKRINLGDTCEVDYTVSDSWCKGAIQKAKYLISKAVKIYFAPVAIMSTKFNDVVIGNLFLQIEGRNIVDLLDELEKWPVFLKRDPHSYIGNLSRYYITRRQHRASVQRPADMSEVAVVTPELNLGDYTALCDLAPEPPLSVGSTVTYLETKQNRNFYKPTAEDIARYSNWFITIAGREYNMLNILLNKARDLYMCERYADWEGIGRATSRLRPIK